MESVVKCLLLTYRVFSKVCSKNEVIIIYPYPLISADTDVDREAR